MAEAPDNVLQFDLRTFVDRRAHGKADASRAVYRAFIFWRDNCGKCEHE